MIELINKKMIDYYNGNLHDIEHFLKVYSYASLIGKLEKLDERMQCIVEISSIVHDIACPLCREKYGNANGKYQERESEALLRPFLAEFALDPELEERIIYLVSHHHTLTDVDGIDYQILLEADFLVNASEGKMQDSAICSFYENIAGTTSGKALFETIYAVQIHSVSEIITEYTQKIDRELEEMVPDVDYLIEYTNDLFEAIGKMETSIERVRAYCTIIKKLDEAVGKGAGNFHDEYELLIDEMVRAKCVLVDLLISIGKGNEQKKCTAFAEAQAADFRPKTHNYIRQALEEVNRT